MNLFSKLENAINFLLIKLGELMLKAVPMPIKIFFRKISLWYGRFIEQVKSLPAKTIPFLLSLFGIIKKAVSSFNFKAALSETYQKAMTQYQLGKAKQTGMFKKFLLTPFLMFSQWLQGLTPGQALLLMTFTAGSLLAVLGIGFSGQRIIGSHSEKNRAPASAEEILYERPEYYKEEKRHFDLTNFRLPVYVAQVNEIRSVDIDFNATLSNRNSRLYLEKNDSYLRDFLIMQLEPSVASFPLDAEGKEIIRDKLMREVDGFLKANSIEGHVIELRITYVLAN